ncbi:MAG: hypothetical protein IJA34_00740 [Lachnospiraceae bacterium]|nr:hypothetical protein [Lachnospiraceae bacterium]
MDIAHGFKVLERLEKKGECRIGEDRIILKNGLIEIETKNKLIHPFNNYVLENPMTIDTFIHYYLYDK